MTLSLAYIVKVVAPSKVPKVLSGGHCLFTSYYKKSFTNYPLFFDTMYIERVNMLFHDTVREITITYITFPNFYSKDYTITMNG